MSGSSVVPSVSIDEALARVANGTALIDVREQGEWDAGHAPSAVFLPLSELADHLADVPTDGPILVICHSGVRSARASEWLIANGIDAINVEGGMVAWTNAGGAVTSSTEA